MKRKLSKRVISCFLAMLMIFSGVIPTMSAFASDGVEGYYDIELFYKDTDTIVPTYVDDTADEPENYVEYMVEGDTLNLTYKLIDTEMPDNGYIKWYSETPTLVDVDQDGVVKAFDSSKGAVIQTWIDNEVKTIPLVGSVMATVLEKALFNDYVDVDTMDTDAICSLVEDAFGSDSVLSKYVESYEGDLVDSLRYYLDHINSNVHVQLYSSDGTLLDDDYVQIVVTRCEEWYANFLPNGTHITNKSQINTTVAVGSTVQLTAVTTPVRLEYGCIYSVKSSSIFDQGKVVATVDDDGLVTFKNTGTVTIMVSPDTEQVIQNILKMINYFYSINTDMIDTKDLADILIKYVGIDMNRNVLAALLDACFAVAEIAGDSADPVQLTATAAKIIGNLVLQFVYNDTITFTVVEAQPLTDFSIDGPSSVQEGAEIQLSVTDITPTVGDTTDITWRSSDPSIASVDPDTGIVTGRDAGGSLGSLSSQKCTIYAVSAANNIERSFAITVKGKTGKYISDVEITGDSYLEMGMETDYSYTVYPARVATGGNLYITWGLVSGQDDDGNDTYIWADSENAVENDLASIDSKGHYVVKDGGECTIAMKAQTGYYIKDGSFYEISSFTRTFTVTNGIPVESIVIRAVDGTSNGELDRVNTVTIGDNDYTYVTIHKGVAELYNGNGAVISAEVYPENASNQDITWVVDNSYYKTTVSDDTHTATVKQQAAHEVADTFNIYAVSQDGVVVSNTITICITKNYVQENIINEDSIEVTRGNTIDATHTLTFNNNDSFTSTSYACYKCNWYSSDESVFTVETQRNDNRDATITAVDVGTATLYCVSADGGIVDTVEVTVYPDKEYLSEIVTLCDRTVIKRTSENAALYKKYMNKLDLAYYILYDEPMASQTTCDTYANELLIAFYKMGGFVGISSVDILGTGKTELDRNYVTVSVGSTTSYTKYSYDFDYSISPKNAMYSSIEWTSSNPDITVDKNGKCTPTTNDPCSAKITVTVKDYMGAETSASAYIAFARKSATGVSLDTTEIVGGKIGETYQLTATVEPSSLISGASCKDVYWTSSDESIATVDDNGLVTFVEGGDCIVTATTYDGGFVARCAVNVVTNYTALSLLVQQYTDLSLNSVNFYPDTWEVFDTAMTKAKNMIDQNNSSQTQVNAMYDELEEAYNGLKKYNYIQKVELYLDGEQTQDFYQYDLSLLSEGVSYKNAVLDLNVRLYPNNGSYASVSWVSSNTDISVSSDGKCSPTVNESCYGMITCTVTDHFGNEFSDSVWVSFSYYPVTSLELSETTIAGEIGSTHQLGCTVYPTGTSLLHIGAASIQDYYWESDDENIATVDENGLVTFVSAGATVVRAVSYDGGISAECVVSAMGDRTALKQALDDYADIDYTAYEYSYGVAFNEAYQEAEKALTDNSFTQEKIDEATNNLISAYEAMINHPYVEVSSVTVSYTTYKKSLTGTASQVASGTVGSKDAVSVNLSSSYSNWNDYNYIVLSAVASPSDAMYKSISWAVDSSSGVSTSLSNASLTVTPKEHDEGGWAIATATITDNYDRITTRTVYVTLSDKICTGFDIADSSKTMLATAEASAINYTISGSPEITKIIWTSSDTSVATVDENGYVTPVEKGTCTITGKTIDGGYTDSIKLEVQTDFSALATKQSEYYNLIQEVKDAYTYTQASLDVLSEVVDEAQTMINEGKATQVEANEMITKLDNAYNSLVLYVAVSSIELGYEESTYVSSENDGFIRYKATSINNKSVKLVPVFNSDDAVYTDISWTSSNENVTVNDEGLVTNGSANAQVSLITCTVSNIFGKSYTASAYVSFVRYGATGISFSDEKVFGAPASQVTLSPVISNEGDSKLSSAVVKDCKYTSNDPSIAEVDDNGVVTFISQGEAVITATTLDGGYTATISAYTTWDTTALKAAIDEGSTINYEDYAYDYGTAFNEAYNTAVDVYANVYASQDEIDSACLALTEAISNLEGNEFIIPVISVTQNDTALASGDYVQVDADTQQAEVKLSLNDGAMIKSSTVAVSDESGVEATVTDNTVAVTKTADNGSFTMTVLVVDDYNREYTETYTFNVIEQIIPVTSFVITADGEEVGSTLTKSCGGSYTNFSAIQLGYITTPANANAITSVEYSSSASTYVSVDSNGLLNITAAGKISRSVTSVITVTITNADGSTATNSVTVTITRA